MSDPQVEDRIRVLAKELHERLTYCLTHGEGPEHDAAMQRARDIRDEIESYGYPVLWSFGADAKTFASDSVSAPRADITILQVKEDLTPELQAIYDRWLLERAGRKGRSAPDA